MNVPAALREARSRSGLAQAALAELTGTSQATISAYESAAKRPSVETLERLLAATGARLTVADGHQRLIIPSARRHARSGRALAEVLVLAESLPTRHEPALRFPSLSAGPRAA